MKIVIVATALCLILVKAAFCQPNPQLIKEPTFPSPNAASLGKYGDIPVSYHTGVPNISIPLYTIQEGPLTLPISLSYHSSGVRVDEVASFVGLGWSLNAGGMISRTVQGGPDEGIVYGTVSGGQSTYQTQRWGWYKNNGYPSLVGTCGTTPLLTTNNATTPWTDGCASLMWEAAKGYVDCEPDLYTYNFGNYSGKFFFDANRKVHMIPEMDLLIEPVNTPSYFYSWKVITPDGTKYFFGGGSATEMSFSDPSEMGSNKHVSSNTTWYLYRIESINGESFINLEYVDDTYSFGNRQGHNVTFREIDYTPPGQSFARGGLVGNGVVFDAPFTLGTTIVDGKRLSRITTSSGFVVVDFIPSAEAREDLSQYYKSGSTLYYNVEVPNTLSKSLQYVQIQATGLCKKFELSYDYFPSTTCSGCTASWVSSTFDQKRLRLNWVQESDCGTLRQPRWEFYYNTQPLPRRYSLARDMWGYYNGMDSNTGLIETFSNPVSGINMTYTTTASRAVNSTAAQAGILTTIKYPTSGTTEFIYESHRVDATQPILGGLRIKSIIDGDDFGNLKTTNITYVQGVLYVDPNIYKNHYPNNNDVYTASQLGAYDFGIAHGSDPTPPMWSSQGYHIGYTKVKVEEPSNGYTIYRYLNTTPGITLPGHYPFKPAVAGIGTPDQIEQTVYREGITDENIFLSRESLVKVFTGSAVTVNAKRVQQVSCINCSAGRQEFGLFMDYSIPTNRFNMTEQHVIKDGVTTSTYFTYDATHNAPKSSQFTDSNGLLRRTEYTYPGDVGSGAPASMYSSADPNFKYVPTTPVEERNLVAGVLKAKTTYQFAQNGTKLQLTGMKKFPTATTDFVEEQYQYDANSNITAIQKSNGSNKSFLWGYGGQFPIAAIEYTAKYTNAGSKFFHTSFEEEPTNFVNEGKTGKRSWSAAATYTKALTLLEPGPYVLSYFLKSGSTWTYQESTVTVPGTGNYTISIPPNSQIDELRFFPKGAIMQTSTYDRGLGITSSTNASNITSTYVYDALGRLTLVKNDLGEIVKVNSYNYKLK